MHGRPTAAFDWAVGGAVIAAGAFAWLVYFRWKDHHPEPVRHVAGALFLGVVAAGLALLLYGAVEALGGPVAPGPTAASAWGFSLLVVGPVEEVAKWAVLVAVVTRWRAFDEEIDGLVYAATIALGFACVESLLYLPHLPWEGRVARALSTPLSHAVFSSAFGFGVGHARFVATTPAARWGWPVATLALSALAHGVYDALILAHDATLPAAVVVFGLWGVLVLRARQIVARLELAAARRPRLTARHGATGSHRARAGAFATGPRVAPRRAAVAREGQRRSSRSSLRSRSISDSTECRGSFPSCTIR